MALHLPAIPTLAGNPCLENGCTACCHDTEMLLTEADLVRLRRLRPDERFWHVADDGFLQLETVPGPPLPGQTGRRCWFLADDGRCSVHDDRPEGCRLYPALWDVDALRATMDAEHCPHTAGFRLTTQTGDAVGRLAGRLEAERRARLGSKP